MRLGLQTRPLQPSLIPCSDSMLATLKGFFRAVRSRRAAKEYYGADPKVSQVQLSTQKRRELTGWDQSTLLRLFPCITISTFSEELIQHIARYTDDGTLLALAAVSRRFYSAARRCTLWTCLSDTHLCMLPRLLDNPPLLATSPSLYPSRIARLVAGGHLAVRHEVDRAVAGALRVAPELVVSGTAGPPRLPLTDCRDWSTQAFGRADASRRPASWANFLPILVAHPRLRQLDATVAYRGIPVTAVRLPHLHHLTHFTLQLEYFSNASLLELGVALFPNLVSLDLSLQYMCTTTEEGILAAFELLPPTLPRLRFRTGTLQPCLIIRNDLLARFRHLTEFLIDINEDHFNILNHLPPSLEQLEVILSTTRLLTRRQAFSRALYGILHPGGLPNVVEILVRGGRLDLDASEVRRLRKVAKKRGIRLCYE